MLNGMHYINRASSGQFCHVIPCGRGTVSKMMMVVIMMMIKEWGRTECWKRIKKFEEENMRLRRQIKERREGEGVRRTLDHRQSKMKQCSVWSSNVLMTPTISAATKQLQWCTEFCIILQIFHNFTFAQKYQNFAHKNASHSWSSLCRYLLWHWISQWHPVTMESFINSGR